MRDLIFQWHTLLCKYCRLAIYCSGEVCRRANPSLRWHPTSVGEDQVAVGGVRGRWWSGHVLSPPQGREEGACDGDREGQRTSFSFYFRNVRDRAGLFTTSQMLKEPIRVMDSLARLDNPITKEKTGRGQEGGLVEVQASCVVLVHPESRDWSTTFSAWGDLAFAL